MRTLVNRFYTVAHSFARLWNTILEVLGISHSVSEQSLTAKELRGGGRAKQSPNLITCYMTFTSAHYLKP